MVSENVQKKLKKVKLRPYSKTDKKIHRISKRIGSENVQKVKPQNKNIFQKTKRTKKSFKSLRTRPVSYFPDS